MKPFTMKMVAFMAMAAGSSIYGMIREADVVTLEMALSGLMIRPSVVAGLNIDMQSTIADIPQLSQEASSPLDATAALVAVYGDEMGDDVCTRVLHKERGEGFWHKIVMHGDASHRMVYYAPGEYVQPHYHDIYEKFTITAGGCHVWLSQDEGATWVYQYCGVGELLIPDGAWHCLIAGQNGLCMDIWKDVKRTINWLTEDRTPAWNADLKYTVRTEELREATVQKFAAPAE